MGKKHRSKQGDRSGVNMKQKKQLVYLAAELFKLCVFTPNRNEEWDHYLKIFDAVEEFQQKQKAGSNHMSSSVEDRFSYLPPFLAWLKENGVTQQNVKIHDYGADQGLGVIATADIKADESLVLIPRKVMFSYDEAKNSYLKELIETNEVLSVMPNVCLALYLHCESCNPSSKYKPYIDILPRQFTTTLYFTPDEMKFLKGSSVLSSAINQYRSIVRQFALLYQLLSKSGGNQAKEVERIGLAAREAFTFDAYRWCVSAVSTRQNMIPRSSKDRTPGMIYNEQQSTLALIPLWDMFNHAVGPMSTTYDLETDKLECLAMADFNKGGQVTICYGGRNSSDLLVHNGFLIADNPFDKVKISLGVSPKDLLYGKKTQLLTRLNCESSGQFAICSMNGNLPTSPDLLAFLRIFHMSEVDLDHWLSKEDKDLFALREVYISTPTQCKNDAKMWTFLENRVKLLLMERKKFLPNNIDEMLADNATSSHVKLALRAQTEERKVLEACVTFCHKFLHALEKQASPDFQQLSKDILHLSQGVADSSMENQSDEKVSQSTLLDESSPPSKDVEVSVNEVNGNLEITKEDKR